MKKKCLEQQNLPLFRRVVRLVVFITGEKMIKNIGRFRKYQESEKGGEAVEELIVLFQTLSVQNFFVQNFQC